LSSTPSEAAPTLVGVPVADLGRRAYARGVPWRVSYLVGRLDRLLARRLTLALAPLGLSLPEYTTLSVLGGSDGLSNAQLARRSLITPQAMNEVLRGLEERGLVLRRPGASRGRVRPAQLTAAGRRALAAGDAATAGVEESLVVAVPAARREMLRELLEMALRGLAEGP
jgi:DNA-binding MarR family transcriptional regulator